MVCERILGIDGPVEAVSGTTGTADGLIEGKVGVKCNCIIDIDLKIFTIPTVEFKEIKADRGGLAAKSE